MWATRPEGLANLQVLVVEAVRAWRECPHLKIEIWGTRHEAMEVPHSWHEPP